MIKTTYGKLADLRDLPALAGPLTHLNHTDTTTTFANRVQIGRLLKVVVEAIQVYELDYAELVKKHGEPQPGSQTFRIRDTDLDTFRAEDSALRGLEIELTTMPLTEPVLEHTALTPRDINLLDSAGLITISVPALV